MLFLFPWLLLLNPFTQIHDWACRTFFAEPIQQTHAITPIQALGKKPVITHIFIHGTRLPGLLILDPRAAIRHFVCDGSSYVKQLNKLRKDERFYEDQIMQEEGLVEISTQLIEQCRTQKLPIHLRKRAALHVITGYDHFIDKNTQIPRYYTYGWVGVLDDAYRQRDAKQLYHTLITLRNQLAKQYPGHEIQLILHGHSHGGNLILYLAKCENELTQGLCIQHAGLYGTPIQKETVQYCMHPCFKHIAVFYSRADKVQIADFLSVKSKTSCRRFSDLISWKPASDHCIQEVCVSANGHPKAFGHADFFYLDEYRIRRIRRGIRPHHRAYQILNPLPVVLFASLYLPLLQEIGRTEYATYSIKLDIACNNHTVIFKARGTQIHLASKNVQSDIQQLTTHFKKQWKPYTSFNYLHKTQWMMK